MKTKSTIFRLGLLCLIFLTQPDIVHAQKALHVIIDFSGSVRGSGQIDQSTLSHLRQELVNHFQASGDFAVISFAYGNSAAANNGKMYSLTLPKSKRSSRTSQQLQQVSQRGLLARLKQALIDEIIADVKAVKSTAANRSEILESLVTVRNSARNSTSLRVVIFGDMLENSQIRSLYNLRTAMQAEQWGKADVQTLRNMYRLPDKLANRVKIQCYLPRGLSMDTRPGMKLVPNYWREIFRGFFFHTDVTFQSI